LRDVPGAPAALVVDTAGARGGPSVPAMPTLCAGSVRTARDSTGDWYAVWWALRPDSTADVVVARSADAKTWRPAVRVDSTDTGRLGCRRPAPSIAADGGNIHVAYAMTAREGPGIFASHSMDRGTMFHSPVAIVYGERPGLTAVGARGNLVAVAYEDPNTNPTRIGLALSRTMAHTFESRELVSPETGGGASAPRVSLRGDSVAVIWSRGDIRVVRRGTLP
jgi:hypothetical protein